MESITSTEWREEDLKSSTMGSSTFNGSTISMDITRNYSLLNHASKRLFDIVLATFAIVVLIPVFLVIAVCIILEDGGDVFYFREIIGLRGRRFFMLKFRTMLPNADTYLEQHPELKLEYQKNMKLQYDPRITRLGRFLRKTYLDELPQLFNVLLGQMSFVGPRAIHQSELAFYGEYAEKRHTVKPGITGLWQLHGRGHTSYEERIMFDMRYIDTCSYMHDLGILFKTFKVFVIHTGA